MQACAVQARVAQSTGKPIETRCPHQGDGDKCGFVKAKLAESNDIGG
jgi:hypothetical protein